MFKWAGAVIIVVVLTAAICIWLGARRKERRLDRLIGRIDRLKRGRSQEEANELLRQIYELVQTGIASANSVATYQAIDILKTAFTARVIRQAEANYLTAVIIQAIQAKAPDAASAALDAYRLMLRSLPTDGMVSAVEQLGFVAAVAMRNQHNFLAAKVADIVYELFLQPGLDPAVIPAILQTVKIIGILSLRRRDSDLFRELTVRLALIDEPKQYANGLSGGLVAVTTAWLHRIMQSNDVDLFSQVADCVSQLADKGILAKSDLPVLIREWQGIAGSAMLNPGGELAEKIIGFTLKAALDRRVSKDLDSAAAGAAQLARVAISRQGIGAAFPILLPLLNIGRELLSLELKFGNAQAEASFRRQSLHRVVRECLAIAEFAARRDLISTTADVLTDLYHCWLERHHYASPKTIKRFCQLLLVYWLQNSRLAAKVAVDDELAKPPMFSEADRQRLGFMA